MTENNSTFDIETIISYGLSQSQLENFVKQIDREKLEWYDTTCHGRGITAIVNHYLYFLQEISKSGRYPFVEIDGRIERIGNRAYYHLTDFRNPGDLASLTDFKCSSFVPKEVLTYLREEYTKAVGVLDAFKKLNWALKKKFNVGDLLCKLLGGNVEDRAIALHESLVDISAFHQSERARPFLIDKSTGLSVNFSNHERNRLYDFVKDAFVF